MYLKLTLCVNYTQIFKKGKRKPQWKCTSQATENERLKNLTIGQGEMHYFQRNSKILADFLPNIMEAKI